MNKKKFVGLIVMMLLSIVGIIWVQIIWIRNAVNIQNAIFKNNVMRSLVNTANDIERTQQMNFFNNFWIQPPLGIKIHRMILKGI